LSKIDDGVVVLVSIAGKVSAHISLAAIVALRSIGAAEFIKDIQIGVNPSEL
jgi:hypothetical protein